MINFAPFKKSAISIAADSAKRLISEVLAPMAEAFVRATETKIDDMLVGAVLPQAEETAKEMIDKAVEAANAPAAPAPVAAAQSTKR